MTKPSELVKEYLQKAIEEASTDGGQNADVIKLIALVNQMIDDLAELILDLDITFGDKFQAIADIKYLSNFLESTMDTLETKDLARLISDDPYDRIIEFLKDPIK
jgi:hypothetical protein